MMLCCPATGQLQNKYFSFGLDYRQYPIDIENVPRGSISAKGLPDNSRFWKIISLHGRIGFNLNNNWYIGSTFYLRYNHLHWLQGKNLTNPSVGNRKEKKNFKYDWFVDIEKRVQLKKNTENYFIALVGLGFTNLNSRFNVFLQDTLQNGTTSGRLYSGTYKNFGPRISIGYQNKKINTSIDSYIIEGPDLNNLIALWIGLSVRYEVIIKPRN
jgi:hypothetical protein